MGIGTRSERNSRFIVSNGSLLTGTFYRRLSRLRKVLFARITAEVLAPTRVRRVGD